MAILIGMDEAGYGPNFGPLVVCRDYTKGSIFPGASKFAERSNAARNSS
jgi:ribonuclease HIII